MIARLLVASTMFAALSAAASAADLPSIKGPPVYPPPPPAFSWTGVYVGIEGGGAWGSAEQTDSTPWSSGTYRVSGGLVGGDIGYNWQINNFVFGLEGDGSATWMSGSTFGFYPTYPACYLPNCTANLEALGTARGRVGIAFDRFMPYVTGGFAVGSLHGQEGGLIEGEGGSGTTTVPGWTVGAGIEAKLSPNWSAKLEYLHVDLGDHAIFDAIIPPVGVFAQHIRFTSEVVRAGLNYNFDFFAPPAPVVTRY
jgi:outer membrane immunogenic protein